jgi:hypothetical protein
MRSLLVFRIRPRYRDGGQELKDWRIINVQLNSRLPMSSLWAIRDPVHGNGADYRLPSTFIARALSTFGASSPAFRRRRSR